MTQPNEAFIQALQARLDGAAAQAVASEGHARITMDAKADVWAEAISLAKTMLVDEGGTEQQLREALELAETEMRYAGWKILDVENVGRESAYRHVCKALALPAGQPDRYSTGVKQVSDIPDARTIEQMPPEDQRTAAEKWEACYAGLLALIKPTFEENERLKASSQPIKADLEKCAGEE